MAKKSGRRAAGKQTPQQPSRTGKTDQYRGRSASKIGTSKPGGDGPGRKKWTKDE
jgi:hypothetical protein